MNKRDNIRNQKRNQRNKELQLYKNENYNSIIPLLQEYFEEIRNNNEHCILNLTYDLINKFIRENKVLKLISNLEEILGEIPKNPFHDMI
jgi:flagellar biosynthesis/type III secretory pathway protein FliH